MSQSRPPRLCVSIVVHTLDTQVLRQTLQSLATAAQQALQQRHLSACQLYLIDNGDSDSNVMPLRDVLDGWRETGLEGELITGHGNLGYGRGHNLGLSHAQQLADAGNDLYLILNPDVIVQPDTLCVGVAWLQSHQRTVAVAPSISDGHGGSASACKRYPSVLDFLLRGFAPEAVKQRFHERLAHYDMQDLPDDRPSEDIPVISGCFMLFRLTTLKSLNGFDPRYFLYFEDFDLALRAHRLGSLTYLPGMRITHLGGNSAKKGLRHIGMFGRSALRFFNTHGWRWT